MCVVSWTPTLSVLPSPSSRTELHSSIPSLRSGGQTLLHTTGIGCGRGCPVSSVQAAMLRPTDPARPVFHPTSPIMHCAFELIPFSRSSSLTDPRRRSRRDFAKPAVLKATCSASQAAYPPACLCCSPVSSAAGQSSARSICWSLLPNRPPDHCQAQRRTSHARGVGSQLASRPPAWLAKC